MRNAGRLNSLAFHRGTRERLSPFTNRVEQLDPVGFIDMNYPYPHFGGDVPYYNNGTTGAAKIGVLSTEGKIVYMADNPLSIRREFSYSGTNFALSGLSIDFYPITNYLRDTQNMSTTYWTQTSATGLGTPNATGPDGLTSAISITTSASPATISQSRGAIGVGNKRFSVWMRRQRGTGTVEIACNTATYTSVTVTSEWQRFEVTASVSVVVGIRISSSPYSETAIEVFAPMVTRESNYDGNAPEIIHATGSDLTYSGNQISIGTSGTSLGLNEGAFVLEAAPARLNSSARLWTPYAVIGANSSIDESYANASIQFAPSNSTVGFNIFDGFDISNEFNVDNASPNIVRVACSWTADGMIAAINGNTPISLGLYVPNLINTGSEIISSGCSIRYAAHYDHAVDSSTVRELSRIRK
jgi:hypothetical protein